MKGTPNYLPIAAANKRVIPNDLIRSSLFTIANHKIKREYLQNKRLYTFGSTRITYTGQELRQDDEDVWLQLIYHCSREEEESDSILFSPYTFMKRIEWPSRTQYRDKLIACIERLSATNLTIYNDRLKEGLSFSLIRKFKWQDEDSRRLKKWEVWLEPEVISLFTLTSYTKIHWHQRLSLKPLAKWLHSYYTSHREPFPIKVETIWKACGSNTKELKHFKTMLRASLMELYAIGFLSHFEIDMKNRVFVIRKIDERTFLPKPYDLDNGNA